MIDLLYSRDSLFVSTPNTSGYRHVVVKQADGSMLYLAHDQVDDLCERLQAAKMQAKHGIFTEYDYRKDDPE